MKLELEDLRKNSIKKVNSKVLIVLMVLLVIASIFLIDTQKYHLIKLLSS